MIMAIPRALRDMWANRFLNLVTVVTVALAILIVGAFTLFFVNAGGLLSMWTRQIRIMAYLGPDLEDARIGELAAEIRSLPGVGEARFIPRALALEHLRAEMAGRASLLENLRENPLPDAFEVHMAEAFLGRERVALLADQIAALNGVDSVEYGRQWLERFARLVDLFRLTGMAMGGLFFLAGAFIVANTIRLMLFSRREEVEIMRLVGATDAFIRLPFYIQGLIHGIAGGALGLLGLYAGFRFIIYRVSEDAGLLPVRFLPMEMMGGILLGSMLIGWTGAYISIKQFGRA